MNASSIPFKVCIPSRGPARIGIAASSYEHLRQIVRYKYKVSGEFSLQQEDGTIVCDEDYFRLLEPKTTLTVMESPPPFPPLQHAASTAAALAGYQPLCPNHCWPRPSVAAVAGEKNSRAVVHSTICLSHVLCSQLCFYATVGGLVRRSLRRLAPRLQIVVQVYDIWRSRTCRSCLRSLITHPYLEFGTCAIAHCL